MDYKLIGKFVFSLSAFSDKPNWITLYHLLGLRSNIFKNGALLSFLLSAHKQQTRLFWVKMSELLHVCLKFEAEKQSSNQQLSNKCLVEQFSWTDRRPTQKKFSTAKKMFQRRTKRKKYLALIDWFSSGSSINLWTTGVNIVKKLVCAAS